MRMGMVWRAALRHQLLLTFRDRRSLLLVLALSLLFGAVGARILVAQAAQGGAPVREIAVSLAQVPGETAALLRQAGLALVDATDPQGLVEQGAAPLGLVLERLPGGLSARFVVRSENAGAVARAGELASLLGLQDEQRLRAQGIELPSRVIPSIGVLGRKTASAEEWLTTLLTLLVTVPAIGATGAAAELGAGERERKTLEPLLMTPVPPFVLAGAKLVAVLAASLMAAAMAVTVQLGLLLWMGREHPLAIGPLAATAPILLLCVTVAVLISGPALLISLVARSMREATLAMIPLNLAAIGMAYLAVSLPPQGLQDGIWYTPGVGALLLVRLSLDGSAVTLGQVLAVTLSTIVLGLGLISLVARQLRRETVL